MKSVGGQALIEGVLMRSGSRYAFSVREPNGNIYSEFHTQKFPEKGIWTKPFFRGLYALYDAMNMGITTLNKSAEIATGQDSKSVLEKKFGEKGTKIAKFLSIASSLVLAILFFTFLPSLITSFLVKYISNKFLLGLTEGIVKFSIFILYLISIRQIPDIKRVFMYHGAEHKAVFNYESGLDLTPENAQTFSRYHPRCGTSFVFLVLAISIILYSFLSWQSLLIRVITKIIFLPFIFAIGYEVLRYSAGTCNPIIKFLTKPGLYMQRLTTCEPELDQLEVAIQALKLAIGSDEVH